MSAPERAEEPRTVKLRAWPSGITVRVAEIPTTKE
ncbi:hypothetical protein EV139_0877 [Leucobacter luti]|uniref:Uncharacterized protein n=1 Tax=Leucobacter luti TaxID=340320 RepID=A0A4Q7U236_9MICO|nr:hypothetical protein EV139_0877 [Leucobacter luti]